MKVILITSLLTASLVATLVGHPPPTLPFLSCIFFFPTVFLFLFFLPCISFPVFHPVYKIPPKTTTGQWMWSVRVWDLSNLPKDRPVGDSWGLQEVKLFLSCLNVFFIRYISCTRDPDSGQLLQENLECPGDLVFANEWGKFIILGITLPSPTRYGIPGEPGTGECVDYDRATACKTFNQPTTPCLYSCPRCWLNLQLIFFTILLQLKLIGGLDSMLNFEVWSSYAYAPGCDLATQYPGCS